MRIAVPAGTSRGASTRTIRTFGTTSPATVTVATLRQKATSVVLVRLRSDRVRPEVAG
jgi:hypothetical protein